MCGIAGELRRDGSEVVEAHLIRMRETMLHRGPDGEGHYINPNGNLGFAHRRLSIIDLSNSAAQPMLSLDEKVCLTFNGEIYNHVELRKELQALGRHDWRTHHSDTEVILQAYQEWGINCIQKLRGMFAFAIWDENKQQMLIARDRMGIKPLYYYQDSKRFLFASEIKAILAAPEIPRRINEVAFFHFLTFATTPAPNTLFENIFKLPAAHYALVTAQGISTPIRYWDVWDRPENMENQTEDQIGERLLHEIETSVRIHKASDVPVGIFLSGGVDSTINTLLFSKGDTQPVNTFTIDYDSQYPGHESETSFARQVVKMAGAIGHERRLVQDDLLQFLPKLIHLQDEPIADPVCIPGYYVSKMARDANIKVCQVGEGADEIFCGYPNWMIHYRLDQWKRKLKPQALRELALFGLRVLGKEKTFTYEVTRRSFQNELQFWSGTEAFSQPAIKRLLSPRMRDKFKDRSAREVIDPIRQRFLDKCPDPSIVQWMGYMDLNLRLPELLLMRTDKMGMGASIEARVPFLDHKVVEFAMNIPHQHKVAGGEAKHILKHAVREIIPSDILRRKKQGFSVPLEDWFLSGLGETMQSQVRAFCLETDLLDWNEVEIFFREKKAVQCWFLFNMALWWEHWIKASDLNLPKD